MSDTFNPVKFKTLSREIEKLTIECSDYEPVQTEAYRFTQKEKSQFDMHYCLELGIVLEGEIGRYYKSGKFSYGPGEVWFCGMWEPHGWEIVMVPSSVLVFFIHPPFLSRVSLFEAESTNWIALFVTAQPDRPRIPDALKPRLIDLACRLDVDDLHNDSLKRTVLNLRLLEILLRIYDSWNPRAPLKKQSGMEMEHLCEAMRIVFESREHVPVQRAANQCGINRNSLSRMF